MALKKKFVLAIDQGTTGSTALIISFDKVANKKIRVLAKVNIEFQQHFPKPGWVDHDLDQVWGSVEESVRVCLKEAQSKDSDFLPQKIAAIGITNQRETTCAWSKETSEPLAPAIVWQCRRTAERCLELQREGYGEFFANKTGLLLDPYFSATKMQWLLENNINVKAHASTDLALGTVDSFLIYRLSGGLSFIAEASNASRTLLFDLEKGNWCPELLKIFSGIKIEHLGSVSSSMGPLAVTSGCSFLPDGIPISGVLGDQQAALFGQGCLEIGEAKCTYGTGAFLLMNAGARPRKSSGGMLCTVAWSVDGKLTYAMEGSAFIAGAAIQYLRDSLQLIESSNQSEELARSSVAAPGVYFVPALTGLGAPHWNPSARGALLGLTRGSDRGVVCRAALEGVAFEVAELAVAMQKESGISLKALKVDGGAAMNALLMQTQANLLNVNLVRGESVEATGIGAAMMALCGIGELNLSDIHEMSQNQIFVPDKEFVAKSREVWMRGWKKAISAVQVFSELND